MRDLIEWTQKTLGTDNHHPLLVIGNFLVEFLKIHPDQVLVIVVGEFHVQYGGGLGFRIQSRRPGTRVTSLSQIWAEDMTDAEISEALKPSALEGPRADFIWVSRP